MKKICIVTPCYNEEDNIDDLFLQVKEVFSTLPQYEYQHLFIDNDSTDETVNKIKSIIADNSNVKLIVNSRNFGHIRSPHHGLLQSESDATIMLVADLQDPPSLIPHFLSEWENGNEIVIGVKTESHESPIMFFIRKMYYNLINKLSEIPLTKNYTGFGLYDKKIITILKSIPDPYPYFRGLIFEVGFNVKKISYTQPIRKRGITKNNFFTLYDMAMLGICSHSKVPLRIATLAGFVFSLLSFLVALGYFVAKLLFWNNFPIGMAPVVIGLFFFGSMQLFFLGIVGEYIGFLYTKISNRPLVIEKYRINF